MSTIIHDLYKEITHDLRNLKPSKDEDQVVVDNLLKMIHCLSYDVYNNNIDMDFLNKVDVIKQYRQSVIKSGIKDFFLPIVQKFQRLKIMTIVVVYENNPDIWYG